MIAIAAGLMSAPEAVAKARPRCKAGFARNRSGKCVKKKKTTLKKVTTTTVKQTATTVAGGQPESKGTVRLGVIGTSVNVTTGAKTLDEQRKIAEAWSRQVNAAGGINGYKLEVLFKDSKADTARTLQAIKELDSAGVLAIAGQGASTTITGSDDYLAAKKLPIVGGQPYTPEFDTHPMFFPVSSSYYAGVYGQVAAARDVGAKYFRNMYCTEVAACAQSAPVTNAAAQREGMKGDAVGASAVAVDYTANCLDAKQKGVDYIQNNAVNQASLVRDCARQNYHPTYGAAGNANQAFIDSSAGEQVAGNNYEFGIFYTGPEVKRFRDALATTDMLSGTAAPTQGSVQTWLGLEMAGAVLKRMTKANPTRADFLDALYTVKGETLGGQVAPADYTTQRGGQHAFNDCWTEQIVKDGKLYHMDKSGQIVNHLTFICGTGHQY